MNKIDLMGQKFGHLTVIEQVPKEMRNSKKRVYWKCVCDCGDYIKVSTNNLRSGKTTMCHKCSLKKAGAKRRKNIVGQTFGYLTVEGMRREPDKNGKVRTYCDCVCKCGKHVTTVMDNLMKPGLHSCGCARKEIADKYLAKNIDNQKFGRLTVVHENKEDTPRTVLCLCDCGNYTTVSKADLMSGQVLSCGCLQSERTSQANLKDYAGVVAPNGVKIINKAYKNEHGTWVYNCECPICNNYFQALPANVLSGKVSSCGKHHMSRGQIIIENTLKKLKVEYIYQFTIDECKDKHVLPFDFAVFLDDIPILIEYDGKQHYENVNFFGGEEDFELRQKHDEIKNKYCKDNNIKLYRIPYTYNQQEIIDKINQIINSNDCSD